MAGTMSWISINFIVLFGIIIMLPGYCCQNVNILPYPRAYALTDQNLTFQCFSDGNISTYSAWAINGSLGYIRKVNNECVAFDLLNDTSLYNVQCLENGTFVLTILTIKEHDHLAYWSCCLLFNGRYTKWASTTVFVKVPVSSVNISYPGSSSVTMSENSSVEFGCKASRSRPVPTVSWLIDGGTSTRWDDELISHVVHTVTSAGFKTNQNIAPLIMILPHQQHNYYAIRNMQQTSTLRNWWASPGLSLSWSASQEVKKTGALVGLFQEMDLVHVK
ncbi:uncharacterized protein LOC128546021 [Mercenaria mercenaria]|uniref:uncharacterized protein LOC128546021 n=1 Tax=Mercenaria mercenaria TaxID=6596 RepID=UPI00234F9FCC|nr:uncharacterized protein LOC128546021 [Mercenaria mercenaria]